MKKGKKSDYDLNMNDYSQIYDYNLIIVKNMKLCFDHCYNFLLVDVSIKQVIIIKKKLSKNTRSYH